ncbi:hypothetical protein KOW79_004010 [Hemibagrus wyckioides]|uniref:Uncharacterized protein n=1 Tax=Hemibagrus wyckioides TaxID=337641 RepID=A0A9D3P152_9TELE|nr:hypothetical protein KOW79_004010 [Hemibagrus wyckioides]
MGRNEDLKWGAGIFPNPFLSHWVDGQLESQKIMDEKRRWVEQGKKTAGGGFPERRRPAELSSTILN